LRITLYPMKKISKNRAFLVGKMQNKLVPVIFLAYVITLTANEVPVRGLVKNEKQGGMVHGGKTVE